MSEAPWSSGGRVVVEFAEILCVRASWSGGGGVVVEFAEIIYAGGYNS